MSMFDMGYRIIETSHMTCKKRVRRTRSWSDRLLSLPWRPFQRTEMVEIDAPEDRIIIDKNTLIMHPAIAQKLRNAKLSKELSK